jgi:hypothetical protein
MKEIKLGVCPSCKYNNFEECVSETINEGTEHYIVMDCICNKCGNNFTNYYSQDEVRFKEDNGKNISYSNTISKDEKELILDWIEEELEMEENQFSCKEHYEDYIKRVKRLQNKLKGNLERVE